MQALLATLLLAAAPVPKTLLTHGPVRLLEVVAEHPVPLVAGGAEVVVLVEGEATVPIQPGTGPLRAGDSVFAPAPGKWWLTPRPRVRAVILELPSPPGELAAVVQSERRAPRFPLLGGLGEAVLALDKERLGTDAFSQQWLTLRPGAAVPSHQHAGSVELLYVISGRTEVTIDGSRRTFGPGEAVAIPSGAWHDARVVGQEPVRVIQLYAPGGPEQRFRQPPGESGGGTDAGVTSAARPR